mmetsp:Transcript_32559/g.107667  ORF Transcript_32559/g.107667 Transcript_32559/m.107667 type:complete len:214 (+) Transcript_32559:855-1496(+)
MRVMPFQNSTLSSSIRQKGNLGGQMSSASRLRQKRAAPTPSSSAHSGRTKKSWLGQRSRYCCASFALTATICTYFLRSPARSTIVFDRSSRAQSARPLDGVKIGKQRRDVRMPSSVGSKNLSRCDRLSPGVGTQHSSRLACESRSVPTLPRSSCSSRKGGSLRPNSIRSGATPIGTAMSARGTTAGDWAPGPRLCHLATTVAGASASADGTEL